MDFQDGRVLLAEVSSYERLRELHESLQELASGWARCLKQDLQDSLGFSGWARSPGRGEFVRAFT